MLDDWNKKRKIKKEVNTYFREIVEQYKSEFDEELTKYKEKKVKRKELKEFKTVLFMHM